MSEVRKFPPDLEIRKIPEDDVAIIDQYLQEQVFGSLKLDAVFGLKRLSSTGAARLETEGVEDPLGLFGDPKWEFHFDQLSDREKTVITSDFKLRVIDLLLSEDEADQFLGRLSLADIYYSSKDIFVGHAIHHDNPILELALRLKDFSADETLGVMREYISFHFEKVAELEEVVPLWKKDLIAGLISLIESTGLVIDLESISRKIRLTSVLFKDALTAKLGEVFGEYDVKAGVIYLSRQSQAAGQTREVFFHEALHAVSGTTTLSMEDRNSYGIVNLRLGMRVNGPEIERFRWLNEAITERLTMKMANMEKSNSYLEERKLLEEMIQVSGIPENNFYEAYFENFDPKESKPIPKWKELMAKLTEYFGSGFMVRLDKLIETEGIDKAVEKFKTDWKMI